MRRVLLVAAVVTFVVLPARASEEDEGREVVVEIAGLTDEKGAVRCGLYTESNWLESERALKWVDAAYGDGDTATCRFEGVEPGTYGVGAFHDRDADHDIDQNLIGIPTEGLCASNDPNPKMGPPSFDGAAFDHSADRTTVPCTMQY